jgi:hypothetical protein
LFFLVWICPKLSSTVKIVFDGQNPITDFPSLEIFSTEYD